MISLSYSDDSSEKTVLHIAEETDDDLLASTPTTHTTEDLFTIIHRFETAHVYPIHISEIWYYDIQYYIVVFTDGNIAADAFTQKAVGR